MKKNKIFAMMAAAMTFAACSTSDITSDYSFDDDKNTVTVSSVTRAGESQTTTTPTTVDMREPFLLTNLTQKDKAGYNYEAVFEYNNNVWEPSEKVMWYGSGDNVFQATYPCATKNGYQLQNIEFDKFMIPGYQYNNSDSIPDWMRATIKATRSIENGTVKPLAINLQHMLSKVTVVCNYSGTPTIDGKTITGASVNKIFTRVQYCKAVTDENGNVTIEPYQKTDYDTDGLYIWTTNTPDDANKKASTTAIVAPGAYTNIGKIWINYDGGSEEIVVSIPNGITLVAGKHYTFTLKGNITHNQAIISSVEVTDWIDGDIQDPEQPADYIPYVTFSAESEQRFKMTKEECDEFPNLEYSVNYGSWYSVVANTEVLFGGNKGSLRLRGTGNLNGTTIGDEGYSKISFINTDVQVKCTGDIRTLLDYTNFQYVETKYAKFCNLFEGCTQLTTAPELPAMELGDRCYSNMFSDCSSLTTAPALPATTLAVSCYDTMFYGCTALKKAPELPATTLANFCYFQMFSSCSALTTAPELPAENLANSCYWSMFSYCTALTSAPDLPAKNLANSCYSSMFSNCTALTSAPELPATTLAQSCYYYMFYGCTKLKEVTMLATDVNATDCLSAWLKNAGTSATSRTLKVNGKEEYDKIKATIYGGSSNLPDIWKASTTTSGATILDKDGNNITSSTNP